MIHRIRIQNYKSIRDQTVELSPVTVLIGRSGAGKTNFCEAIRLLRDLLALGPQKVSARMQAAKPLTHDGSLSFCVDFTVDGYDEEFRYEIITGIQHQPHYEALAVGKVVIFSQSQAPRIAWKVPPNVVVVPEAGPLALSRLPSIELTTAALSCLTGGLGIYTFPYNVLENSKMGESALRDDATNALGTLHALWSHPRARRDRASLFAALRQLNSAVATVGLDSLQNAKQAIVGHFLGEKTLAIPLGSESSGFRRFLAHLLALYQTPPKQTLIFEEPENGIFPGALDVLAEEFQATPEAGRGQVILTTHNPVFLNKFHADQIRVVEMNENLETEIGPLSPEQREALQEKLLYPGELFTVDLARREVAVP